jgi:gas vesicle protein
MIKQNKIISLSIIGLVLGGIIGAVINSEQANMTTLAAYGGIIGFLAGWIWNSRSSASEDSDSDGPER